MLPFSSRDTAPFGLAKLPQPGALGRMRNAGLNWMVPNLVFKDCYAHYEAISRRLGFPQPEFGLFDFARGADLFLQGSAPSFEYPRTDLPGNVRFIGATIPPPPARWSPPEWWRELDGSKPVVLVTQGTVANDYDDVLRPALRAMAGEDVVVIATTGSKPPSDLGMELPANARAAQFLPYAALMPKVDVMVTNGGYGSIQIALAHGVPVISFGVSEDKAEITNRVGWSGVGLGFKQKRAAEPQVRDAVRRVLGSPAFRKRAGEMQRELGTYRGPDFAAELVGSILGEPAVQSAGAGRP
ncbi:MAG TPA: nucleotide disphospho-sugar-binding domain-containing protein [Fimbriimonadaceae bacterium]|nr:nucleotide disphospho-sugar-binding domain-containing protein [Fimbriimonadaceae bacterium]